MAMTSKNLAFKATNRHVEGCGEAPAWCSEDSPLDHRRLYMENRYGEQMVADVSLDCFRFVLGDAGWGEEVRIDQPDYKSLLAKLDTDAKTNRIPRFHTMSLNAPELGLIRTALLLGVDMTSGARVMRRHTPNRAF